MKILLSYIHYPVASGRYMKEAFQRLGYDVKSVGWSTGNQIWGMTVDPKYTHAPDGYLDAVFPDWVPDLIIHMDSAFEYHHPAYDAPHVVYGVDNHVRDYRQAGIDHYFLAHNAVSIMDMSAKDVTWLPCGFDPNFTPSPIAWDERPYDVALIGVIYENRALILDALQKAGLKVFAGMGALYDDYANVYHQSRISLNVSANHDLNQRIFETSALGCVVLSDEINDLADLGTKAGLVKDAQPPEGQIVTFTDAKDAVKQAQAILKTGDPKLNKSWLGRHTWDVRALQILTWYEKTYRKTEKVKNAE